MLSKRNKYALHSSTLWIYCRSRNIHHGLNFVNFVGRIGQQNEIHDEILTIMLINAELLKPTKLNPDECFLGLKRTKF
jgi:hypothetical protein